MLLCLPAAAAAARSSAAAMAAELGRRGGFTPLTHLLPHPQVMHGHGLLMHLLE